MSEDVFKTGRKAVKLKGRTAGEEVTIVKRIDESFIEVKDAKGKTKRCNVLHLELV